MEERLQKGTSLLQPLLVNFLLKLLTGPVSDDDQKPRVDSSRRFSFVICTDSIV